MWTKVQQIFDASQRRVREAADRLHAVLDEHTTALLGMRDGTGDMFRVLGLNEVLDQAGPRGRTPSSITQ